MSKSKKYHLLYVKNSVPKLKSFETKEQMDRFIKRFKPNSNFGDWLDLTFKGDILDKSDVYGGKCSSLGLDRK